MSHDIGYLGDKAMNDSFFLKKCKKGNDSIEEARKWFAWQNIGKVQNSKALIWDLKLYTFFPQMYKPEGGIRGKHISKIQDVEKYCCVFKQVAWYFCKI